MGAIESLFQAEGFHDLYNYDASPLSNVAKLASGRKAQGVLDSVTNMRAYDFIIVPNCGFLNSNLPLLNDCELKLSFDRLTADVSLLSSPNSTPAKSIAGKPIAIKDCVAITEYVSSESLRNYFSRIESQPILYNYEECEITLKNLPLNETDIRLDNIKGGRTPILLFAGVIPTVSLNGDLRYSSNAFTHSDVEHINITLNGNAVNGYPLEIKNGSPVQLLHRFNDVTNRLMNPFTGDAVTISKFASNWVYSHRFEGESTKQGWIGLNLKLGVDNSKIGERSRDKNAVKNRENSG